MGSKSIPATGPGPASAIETKSGREVATSPVLHLPGRSGLSGHELMEPLSTGVIPPPRCDHPGTNTVLAIITMNTMNMTTKMMNDHEINIVRTILHYCCYCCPGQWRSGDHGQSPLLYSSIPSVPSALAVLGKS